MRDAYIVSSVRTPGCRRGKGALKDTRPDDLLAFIMGEDLAGAGCQMHDVMRATDFTVPGIIAHQSAMKGGEWMDVPLFNW